MSEQEMLALENNNVIKGGDLKNQSDRTLIWGYTCDKDSFHVYLKNGVIHCIVYNYHGTILNYVTEETIENNLNYIPNKRVYPEASDFEFCQLVQEKMGYKIAFTSYNHEREDKQYHGMIK